jgi:hypothetical protein
VHLLTEDINHNCDHIKPVCLQKLHDEVHQDGVPVLIQNLAWMKLTMGKSPKPSFGCMCHRVRHTGRRVGTAGATSSSRRWDLRS